MNGRHSRKWAWLVLVLGGLFVGGMSRTQFARELVVRGDGASPVRARARVARSVSVGEVPSREAAVAVPMPVAMPFVVDARDLVAGGARNGLMTRVLADGTVHVGHSGSVDVAMRLTHVGGRSVPVLSPRAIRSEGGRAIVDRGDVLEWYVSASRGVEQGFDLLARPDRSGEVTLRLSVSGAKPRQEGANVVLTDADGTGLLAYRDLVVVDANGRELTATMRAIDSGLELAFDDRGAVYPVRVDPFVSMLIGTLTAPNMELMAGEGCGFSVAIENDVAVVGCPFAAGPQGEPAAGAAFVFTRVPGGTYTFTQKLIPSIVLAQANFGHSVAIAGTIAVGAPAQTNTGGMATTGAAGAAFVFAHGPTLGWMETAAALPSDPTPMLRFGASVAVAGARLVVGAPGGSTNANALSTGSVYVFDLAAGGGAAFSVEFAGPTAVSGDEFGRSVAASGSLVAVGAPNRDGPAGQDEGAAYVFTLSGSTTPVLSGTLTSPSPMMAAHLGYDVDIDGTRAVAGCPHANTARGAASGAVGVYELASTWSRVAWLSAADGIASDLLGASVALDGGLLIAGSPATLTFGASQRGGAAYVFVYDGVGFIPGSKLQPADVATGDGVGFDVGIDASASAAIVGAPLDAIGALAQAGSARVFGLPEFAFLRVEVHGTGVGGVGSMPDGILCGSDCVEAYAVGASILLDVSIGAGSYLASVTGACTAAPCTVVLAADRSAEFVFDLQHTNGQTCQRAVECTSGSCVDGVCCGSPCGGGARDCQACSVASGGTTDGTCTALAMNQAAMVECRPSAGACDLPETCASTSKVCPSDARQPSGFVCRPAASTACDSAEACDGTSLECPTNVHSAAGTPCDNGSACDGIERCNAVGACASGAVPTCVSDNNRCTVDVCVDPVGCLSVAQPGCTVVDGGAVFTDAGILILDAAVDADTTDSGPVIPPPPTFRGQGGCGCRVAAGSHDVAPTISTVLLCTLALIHRRRRRVRGGAASA